MPIACSTGQTIHRSTSLPAISPFTVMFWHRIDGSTGGIHTFWKFGGASGSGGYRLGWNSPTQSLHIKSEGNAHVIGSALSTSVWYHIAMAVSGTGASQCLGYLNGVLDGTQNGNSATPEEMNVGWWGEAAGEEDIGSFCAFKFYTRALSAAEIATEMQYYRPISTDSLLIWSPWRDVPEVATNYASSVDWTIGGTHALADGPPIAWEPPRGHARRAAAAVAGHPAIRRQGGIRYGARQLMRGVY